jgi:hypothetical protein
MRLTLGTPGVRSLSPEKMTGVTELGETFEPRFEIEVSQAGDIPKNPRFQGRPGPRRYIPGFGITRKPAVVRTVRRVGKAKHVVRCNHCSKLFYRVKMTTRLGKHTTRDGLRCSGSNTLGTYQGFR